MILDKQGSLKIYHRSYFYSTWTLPNQIHLTNMEDILLPTFICEKFPFLIRRSLCAKFCFFLQLQIRLTTAGREWEKLLITIVTSHGRAITTPPK